MLRATIQESAIGKDTHEQYTAFTNLIEAHAAHPEAVFCKQCDKVLFCIIVRNKIKLKLLEYIATIISSIILHFAHTMNKQNSNINHIDRCSKKDDTKRVYK